MANVNEEVLRLTLDDASFRKGIQQITVSLEQLKKALNLKNVDDFDKLDKAVKKVKFDELSKSAEKMSNSVAKSSKSAAGNLDDMGKSGKKSIDSIEKASDGVKLTNIKTSADSAAEAVKNSAKSANDSINSIGADAKGLKSVSVAAEELNKNVQNVKLNPLQRAMQALHDVGVRVKNAFSNLFSSFSLKKASSEVDGFRLKLDALSVVGMAAISRLTNAAINFGQKAFHGMIEGITDGFHEYETQLNAIQTIYANTSINGTSMTQITRALDTLNTYADKTIYNFTQMTHNIGMFTAAGVGLQDSVSAIQGIANWAAMCGSNAAQANTAMYQLSQSLATGSLKLQDWNSVVNAGMGGKQLQDALLRTAVHLKNIDWKYAAHAAQDFRQSLQDGWATTEVVSETFKQLTMDVSDYGKAISELVKQGYTEKEAETIVKLAQNSQEAATKVKTFTQLIDTLREAIGSGWTESWGIVLGDLDEAKDLYSGISDALGAMIANSAKHRNDFLRAGMSSGYKQLVQQGIADTEVFTNSLTKFGDVALKSSGKTVAGLIKQYGSFEKSMHSGWVTADVLKQAVAETTATVNGYDLAKRTELGITNDQIKAMNALNDGLQKGTISAEDYVKKMQRLSGRENIIAGFANIANDLKAVFTTISNAWHSVVKPMSNGNWLYSLTVGFRKFTEALTPSKETLLAISRVTKVVAHAFVILRAIVVTVAKIFGTGLKMAFKALGVVLTGIVAIINTIGTCINRLTATSAWHNVVGTWTASIGILKTIAHELRTNIEGIFGGICDIINGSFNALPGIMDKAITNMGGIFGKFKSAGDKCGGAFGSGLESMNTHTKKSMDAIGKGMAAFHAAMITLGQKVKAFGSTVGRVFGKIDFFSIFERILQLLKGGALTLILWNINKFIIGLNKKGEELKKNTFVEAIKSVLNSVASSFKDFVKQFRVTALLVIAGSIKLLADALTELANIPIKKLAPALGAMGMITTILVAAAGVLAYMSKLQMKVGKHGRDSMFDFSAINKCAVGFAALGLAVKLIAQGVGSLKGMNIAEIGVGFGGVVAVIVAMAGASLALAKVNPEAITSVGRLLMSIGGAFIVIGIGLYIVSKAVASFGNMNIGQIVQGFIGFVLALGILSGAIIGLNSIKFKRRKLLAMGQDLLVVSLAMIPLAMAIKMLGSMSWESLGKGLGGMIVALGVVGGVIIAINRLSKIKGEDNGGQFIKIGGQLMLIAVAMNLLVAPIALLGHMSLESLAKGLGSVAIVLLIVKKAMAGMSGMDTKSALESAGAMAAIAGALTLLMIPIAVLGHMSLWSLAKGLGAIAASLTVMFVALAAFSALPNMNASVAVPIIALAGSLLLMAHALKAFNKVSWESIGKGLLMLGVSVGTLVGIGYISHKAGAGLKEVGEAMKNIGIGALALSASFYLVVQAITALHNANISLEEVLVNIGDAIGAILPTIARALVKTLVDTVQEFANSIPELLAAVSTVLDALCGFVITKSPEFCEAFMVFIDNALKSAAGHADSIANSIVVILVAALKALAGHMPEICNALGGIFGAIFDAIGTGLQQADPGKLTLMLLSFGIMAGIFHIMAKMRKDVKNALIVGGSMIALMYAMSGVFAILGTIDSKNLYASAIAINGTLLVMAISFKMISKIRMSVAKALPVLGIMALVMTGMGLIFGLLSTINADNAIKMSGAISLSLLAISGVMTICAAINPAGAISAVGSIATFITALGVMLIALGGIKHIPGVEWVIKQGGDFLKTIGEALGKFVGGIVGGIASGASDGLKTAGKALGGFMKDVKPFFEGLKDLDPKILDKTKLLSNVLKAVGDALASISIAKSVGGKDTYKGFTDALTGLADGIKSYLDSMKGVDLDALNASIAPLKALQEVIASIPPAGGIAQVIMGSQNWATLGDGLVDLAKALKGFGTEVAGVDTETISSAAPAMQALTDVLNNVPSAGGIQQFIAGSKNWSTLSANLPAMGKALKTFGNNIKGIKPDGIQAAAPAMQALTGVLNALPDDDGLWQRAAGHKDWKTLGNNLVDLGVTLVLFSQGAAGINVANIQNAVPGMQALVNVLNAIPRDNGWVQGLIGDKKWSTISDGLITMGTSLKSYSNSVDGLKVKAIQNSQAAVTAIVNALSQVSNTGGMGSWFVGNKNYEGFAQAAGQLANVLNKMSGIKAINTSALDSMGTFVNKLSSLANTNVNIGGLNNIKGAASALSGTLGTLNSALGSVDPAPLVAKVDAVHKLMDNLSGIGSTQFNAVSLLPINNAIDTISQCVNKLNGININAEVVSVISVQLNALVNAISSVPATLDVTSLSTALNTIATLPLDAVGEKFIMCGDAINNGVTAITNAINAGNASISAALLSLTMTLNGLQVTSNVAAQMDGITNSVNSGANNVNTAINNLVTTLNNDAIAIGAAISSWIGPIQSALEAVANAIKSRATLMEESGSKLGKAIVDGAEEKTKRLGHALSAPIKKAAKSINDHVSTFYDAGVNLAQGLIDGMASMAATVAQTAWNMGRSAAENVKAGAEVRSPSRFTRRVGRFIDDGLILGMKDNLSSITTTANMIGSKSVNEIKNAMSALNDITIDSLDINPVVTPVMDLSGFKEQAKLANSLLDTKMDFVPRPVALSNISTLPNNIQNGNTLYADLMAQPVVRNYTFNQTNNSPKALDRYTIYRNTRTQFEQFRQLEKLRSN
nr:MAG TPA: tail tape measure [Caudoviricetes sp.]